jgi:bacterioferritin (cytochrome b1)
MSHHHSHHDHGNSDEQGRLTEMEKLVKIVEHWIHHNEDHARSYREWGQKANAAGRVEITRILEEVAGGTEQQNENLRKALDLLGKISHK